MKPSTLRLYSSAVCLLTGICFLIALYTAGREIVHSYLHHVESTDLYRFYVGQSSPQCSGCQPVDRQREASQFHDGRLQPYGADQQPVLIAEPVTDPVDFVLSIFSSLLFKTLLLMAAGFIFWTHWRLFRNLRNAVE